MSTVRVFNKAPWCAVPEALLQDERLGHAAARLGAWLSGRPDGWEVKKWHAMKVLHLGETAWDRATRELRAAGYLITVPVRNGGRWAGQDYIFDPLGQHPRALDANDPTPPEAVLPGAVGPGSVEPGAVKHPFYNKTDQTKQSEQTTTTTTSRAKVEDVVVVTEEDQARLIWPDNLTKDQLSSMRRELLGNDWPGLSNAQALLDELAGQLQQPGKVKSAPGLLRMLLVRQREGTFTEDYGTEVRNIREARHKHQAREAAALAGNGQGQMPASLGPQGSGTSEIARREIQRQIDQIPGLAKRKAAKAAAHP